MNNLNYPLVCFDLDGTLVDDTIYIWKTLHEGFETDHDARTKAYGDFFGGKITYRQWFEHDLKLLKAAGATKEKFTQMLNGLNPMPGAFDTIKELKQKGHKVAIISGSLDIVIEHIFGMELFDHVLINKIFFDDQGHIKGGQPTKYDLKGKADGLKELANRENIPVEKTVFIGDNDNDVWIAKQAGLSIAFNCKSESLRQICHAEVSVKDLREVKKLID